MRDSAIQLTQEQIDFFRRNGYLTLESITTLDEVDKLRVIYDRLFEEQAGRDLGFHLDMAGRDEDGVPPTLPQIGHPSKLAPELQSTLFRANAKAVAEQVLGAPVRFFSEHMIFKPAGYGAATPWHQDQAYHDPRFRYKNVNIWMPLQEATLENGCMQFIPGSHRFDVLPHHPINHDNRIYGLEVDDKERFTSQAVACPVPSGGATLHHSYMLHYAGPNRSQVRRRAYIFEYGLPFEEREVPLDVPWLRDRRTALQERIKKARAATAKGKE